MTMLNATEARAKLYSLIDEASETHQPIVIKGKDPIRYSCQRRIGMLSMRLFIWFQCQECVSPLWKGWQLTQRNAARIWIGDVGIAIYQSSSERCKEIGIAWA